MSNIRIFIYGILCIALLGSGYYYFFLKEDNFPSRFIVQHNSNKDYGNFFFSMESYSFLHSFKIWYIKSPTKEEKEYIKKLFINDLISYYNFSQKYPNKDSYLDVKKELAIDFLKLSKSTFPHIKNIGDKSFKEWLQKKSDNPTTSYQNKEDAHIEYNFFLNQSRHLLNLFYYYIYNKSSLFEAHHISKNCFIYWLLINENYKYNDENYSSLIRAIYKDAKKNKNKYLLNAFKDPLPIDSSEIMSHMAPFLEPNFGIIPQVRQKYSIPHKYAGMKESQYRKEVRMFLRWLNANSNDNNAWNKNN